MVHPAPRLLFVIAALVLLSSGTPNATAATHMARLSATDGTTRDTPIAIGSTGHVQDYDVVVLSTTPNADDVVASENSFNDPPSAGKQFYIARVSVTYQGKDTGQPAIDLNFQAVGTSGVGYTTFNDSCGVVPDDPFLTAGSDLFAGGSVEFNVCWSIASKDAGSLVMYVEPLINYNARPVWFSLGGSASHNESSSRPRSSGSPRAHSSASAAPSASSKPTPKNDRKNPLPFGTSGTIGDYSVKVVSVTPNANDEVAAENQFNDPPATGHQFYIARVSMTYNGSGSGNPAFDLNFQAVGRSSVGYSTFDNSCGVVPDDPITSADDLFSGGTVEFNECWAIKSSDADSLVMYVEPSFSYNAKPVWFSLDESS